MAQHYQQPTLKNFRHIANLASEYIWSAYNKFNWNYLAITTIFAVVLLSFMIPDISQRMHATNELKTMNKVLNLMTKEVSRAEVACLAAADEICYLQCSMKNFTTPRHLQNMSVCASGCVRPTLSEPAKFEKNVGLYKEIFFINKNISHKEIPIMSYVYTNSFQTEKRKKNDKQ